MAQKQSSGNLHPPKTYKHLYDYHLGRARGVAEESRQRLRALDEHFPQSPPQEAFEQAGELKGGPAARERRAAPRCGGGQARVIVFAVASPEIIMARVSDWSATGVGLWLSKPLEVGRSLYILPDDYPEAETGALAEVRYCRPDNQGWTVGCQLLRTGLSADRLFGT